MWADLIIMLIVLHVYNTRCSGHRLAVYIKDPYVCDRNDVAKMCRVAYNI